MDQYVKFLKAVLSFLMVRLIYCAGVGDRKVRLISLPRFSESGTIVVVNIGTLECFTVSFGTEEESIDH